MPTPRLHSIFLTILIMALFTLPAAADSQARIVRLSDVQGLVQINKNSGLGFENAFLNLPITQGTELRTRENGRAEIEFEDGSTLRLTPNTTVEFSTLGLSDAGKCISVVNLVEGKAYVYWLGKSGDALTLNFSQEKIEITQAAHFRLAASSSSAEIANFKNDLEVAGPSGTVKVGKNQMVTFAVQENDQPTVAKNFEEDPYDEWDRQAISYHEQYARNANGYGYGASDLGYYGSYTNVPGYGSLWQPYFAGYGWDPFMDGAWAWYPGMGFMWASAYPWGWLPYNYGTWVFAPGFGWGWQPGSGRTPHGIHYVGMAAGFHPPVPPTGTVNTVAVGRGGPGLTNVPPLHTVVRSGSAGLGIPRGSYGNLRHLNAEVAKNGSAELHATHQFAASSAHAGGQGFGGSHFGEGSAGHASGGGHSGGGHSGR